MTVQIALGQAAALDGRDASIKATQNALQSLGAKPISLGFIFASHEFEIQTVLIGVSSQLGKTPLIGLSTSGEISSQGPRNRSVLVALLSGNGIIAKADWAKNSKESSAKVLNSLVRELDDGNSDSALMLVADGLNTNDDSTYRVLSSSSRVVFGCAAIGRLPRGETSQIGGVKSGIGGLAGAIISGISVGVGAAHGWQPVGPSFEVGVALNKWIRNLDGNPAAESYARFFGYQARDWGYPPLNTLVRLYPLGLESENGAPLQLRTPLWMEEDGSLRMSANILDGSIAHLMVGSREKCLEAAQYAARQALSAIGTAKPFFAMVFADASWQKLLEGNPGSEIQAVREVLGPNVPIAGGYTSGQIARDLNTSQVEMLNQHIEVVVFAEK